MVTTNFLLNEEDFEAARTLFQYSRARGNFFEEITTTSLTLPEEEREAEHEAALALIELSKTHPKQHNKKMKADKTQPEEVKIAGQAVDKKPRKIREEDDSDETLRFLVQWNEIMPEKPPFVRELDVVVGVCSKPMRKQVTESDVNVGQGRLMLGKKQVKKMMLHVMGKSQGVIGTNGLEVSVYRPDGKVRKMMLKMWSGDTPVLTTPEWNNFVKDFGLKMHCDFLTIWMFKHRETRQICFALHFTRFPLEKPLSRRIINTVFERS